MKGKPVIPPVHLTATYKFDNSDDLIDVVQNRSGYYWTEDDVHHRLQSIMAREFNAIYDFMKGKNIDMRTAAYAHALSRLGDAVSCQGTSRYFSNGVSYAGGSSG